MKKNLNICFALFISINLTGIAVVLFISANIGSDTITAFIDGLKNVLDCSLGNASKIYNVIILVVALLLSKKNIGWTTIVYALSSGFAIDFYSSYAELLTPLNSTLIGKLCSVLLGQACFAITYALLIKHQKGMNQIDAITYYIVDHVHINYVVIRTSVDVILLFFGWLMGGVVGIGSLISMCTTGIFVKITMTLMGRNKQSELNECIN